MDGQIEHKICGNCKKEIPQHNYAMHTTHCARNITLCQVCKEPIPKNQFDDHQKGCVAVRPKSKKPEPPLTSLEMSAYYHERKSVEDMKFAARKARQIQKYRRFVDMGYSMKTAVNEPPKQRSGLLPCKFCYLELPPLVLEEHENYCGTRTDKCLECGELVMFKYKQMHLDTNHGYLKLKDGITAMSGVGESNEGNSSLSSRGSPPDEQDGLFRHEHPRINFLKWLLQCNVGETQSYENYVRDIISVDVQTATGTLFYMEVEKKECDCYFFHKSQKKCFHVLSPVSQEVFMEATAGKSSKNLRPMLLCNINDTGVLLNLMEQVTLVDRCGTRKVLPSLRCKRCNYVISSRAVGLHRCLSLAYPIKSVWRYKLPFRSKCGKDIVLDDSCIPLCSAELHHLIPIVSQVYERLEALGINTSLVQILAQDPVYQESMDIFEYEEKDREFGTYHLYLYLVHRLLPFLADLSYDAVDMKFLPIFTIVRPNEPDLIRDVTGFVENEVEARLDSCPQEYLEVVQQLFHHIVNQRKVMESENVNKTEEMVEAYLTETIKAGENIDLLKLIDYDDMLETMFVGWLKRHSMRDVAANFLRCLDVTEPVDKFVRAFAASEVEDDSTEWKIHNQFYYGNSLNAQKLTNIFNVIPKARVSGKLLKNAVLFSKGQFNYKSDEPWKRGTKRSFKV